MRNQVAADLRAAADVLERDGWTQETYAASDGCRCVLGAIVAALGGLSSPVSLEQAVRFERFYPAAQQVSRVALGDDDWSKVATWNDAPDRTADEVIAALRAAADRAQAAS